MSYFLWVEDFEDSNVKATASNVFGEVMDKSLFDDQKQELRNRFKDHGVFIEFNFQDGWVFLKEKLDKIDYVILDIDLPAYGGDDIESEVLGLLTKYEDYKIHEDESENEELLKNACDKFKISAGFHLYTKLVVDAGFPKEHILFCSNHGERSETILNAFKNARMAEPIIYEKSNDKVKETVSAWYNNPYSRLRRGIIEGCLHAKKLIENDRQYFNKYTTYDNNVSNDYLINYFNILENFLPLRQPKNKQTLYMLFIRTMSHEWESAKEIKYDPYKQDAMLACIMRNTRNWIAHNSSLFSDSDEQLLAFLFIVNVRVMIDFNDLPVQTYETILLRLFDNKVEPEQCISILPSVRGAYLDLRNLIREENNMRRTIVEAFYFNQMANNVQLSNSKKRNDRHLFTKLLYQMFWLILYNPQVDRKDKNSLEIKFFDFKIFEKHSYLLELAKHIYHRSFPKGITNDDFTNPNP